MAGAVVTSNVGAARAAAHALQPSSCASSIQASGPCARIRLDRVELPVRVISPRTSFEREERIGRRAGRARAGDARSPSPPSRCTRRARSGPPADAGARPRSPKGSGRCRPPSRSVRRAWPPGRSRTARSRRRRRRTERAACASAPTVSHAGACGRAGLIGPVLCLDRANGLKRGAPPAEGWDEGVPTAVVARDRLQLMTIYFGILLALALRLRHEPRVPVQASRGVRGTRRPRQPPAALGARAVRLAAGSPSACSSRSAPGRLHVGALALAPLSLVQAVLAGGVVLLAVMAERLFGFRVGPRQWLGLGLTALGLVLLGVTLPRSTARTRASRSPA